MTLDRARDPEHDGLVDPVAADIEIELESLNFLTIRALRVLSIVVLAGGVERVFTATCSCRDRRHAGPGEDGENRRALSPPPVVSRIPQRHPPVPRAGSIWWPPFTPATSSLMPELPDFLRDLTRKLQVAFDRQWSSVCGLRTLKRANRIVWGTRGPLELEGVESISLGAAAVLARHDSHLRLPSLRELNPELARILAQHRHDFIWTAAGALMPSRRPR